MTTQTGKTNRSGAQHGELRIEMKRNVRTTGNRTAFNVYVRRGNAFVFDGTWYAKGWNASDEKCAKHYDAVGQYSAAGGPL